MIEKLISIWIKEQAQLSVCILLVLLLGCAWVLPDTVFSFLKSAAITITLLGKLVLSLFLVLLALAASLFIVLRKPSVKDYDLINPPGFYKHRKAGGYYCQPCIDQRHIASPLSTISKEEFLCRACKETYKVDYSVLFCDEYLSIIHDRAANEFVREEERCNK